MAEGKGIEVADPGAEVVKGVKGDKDRLDSEAPGPIAERVAELCRKAGLAEARKNSLRASQLVGGDYVTSRPGDGRGESF